MWKRRASRLDLWPFPYVLVEERCAVPKANIEDLPIKTLRPYAQNARTHSRKQIKQIAATLKS